MNARRAALFTGTALAASAALGQWARPTRRMADMGPRLDLEAAIPRSFKGWQIDANVPVLLPAPDVQAQLDAIYNQVLARTYADGRGNQVMLSIAYGGDQSKGTRAHRPEVCYPAQGFDLMAQRADQLPLPMGQLPVRRLVTRLGSRIEPVTYWIVVGEQVATSGTQQKLAEMRYGLQGLIPDGLLMRVSTLDGDAQRAWQVQARFVADLASAIDPTRRSRFIGSPT
jgi:EpsI family protein